MLLNEKRCQGILLATEISSDSDEEISNEKNFLKVLV